jgi:hypothetical protein
MPLIELGDLYVALRKAGVSGEDALKAAEEVADYCKKQRSIPTFGPPRIGTSHRSVTDSVWFFPMAALVGLLLGFLLPTPPALQARDCRAEVPQQHQSQPANLGLQLLFDSNGRPART